MKLYAQCGYGPADKLDRALGKASIDGVILSPRYMRPDRAKEECQHLREAFPHADILLDPEYYAAVAIGAPNAQLGFLEEWPYFRAPRTTEFLVDASRVEHVVQESLQAQTDAGTTMLIAPSVYVSRSLDSMETALALSFLQCAAIASSARPERQVLATLALHRDALLNRGALLDFVNGLTGMPEKPDGVYLLVGAESSGTNQGLPSAELTQPEVLGAWMFLNLVLSLNGMPVVNGYSDLLGPFLGVAGGSSGATGWYSNLQCFSWDRYIRSGGFRSQPLVRYVSMRLLTRLTVDERGAMVAVVPEVGNGLEHDRDYVGAQPGRTVEVCQTWEAVRALMGRMCGSGGVIAGMDRLRRAIGEAEVTWARLRGYGLGRSQEAVDEYLRCLRGALGVFTELAEL